MALRPIADIHKDIEHHEEMVRKLNGELKETRKACPHPESFIKVDASDMNDDCLGPPIYEYTALSFTCGLCGALGHAQYHKEREQRPDPVQAIQRYLEK